MFTDISSRDIYIDGTDAVKEGTFVSSKMDAALSYTNWASGEPNNNGNGDCIAMLRDSGKWDDVPCDATLPAICEIEECEFIEFHRI